MRNNIWNLILLLLILTGCLFVHSCTGNLPRDEAENHLRAFDNEIISQISSFRKVRSLAILEEMFAAGNVPLPFNSHNNKIKGDIPEYNIDDYKGIYAYDDSLNAFIKVSESSFVILDYKYGLNKDKPVRFILYEYAEEAIIDNAMYPTRIRAELYVSGEKTATIIHKGKVKHQLPVAGDLRMDIENLKLVTDLSIRFRGESGDLRLRTKISRGADEIMSWNIRSKVGMTDEIGLFFHSLDISFYAFPVIIKAVVDNDAIRSSATDFVEEFNKHSKIWAVRAKDNAKLGDIKLKHRVGDDRMNHIVTFNDGSYVFMEDMMIIVKKINEIKFQNLARLSSSAVLSK